MWVTVGPSSPAPMSPFWVLSLHFQHPCHSEPTFETRWKIKERHDYQRIDMFAVQSRNLLGSAWNWTNRTCRFCYNRRLCVPDEGEVIMNTVVSTSHFVRLWAQWQLVGIFEGTPPVCVHGALRGSASLWGGCWFNIYRKPSVPSPSPLITSDLIMAKITFHFAVWSTAVNHLEILAIYCYSEN